MDVCGCTAEVIGQVANGPKEAGLALPENGTFEHLGGRKAHPRGVVFVFKSRCLCLHLLPELLRTQAMDYGGNREGFRLCLLYIESKMELLITLWL